MPRIQYITRQFRAATLAIIERAEGVCAEYARQGYDLTLRQLYYQFVARGWLPNRQTEYDRLGSIVNDARLAGLLDWNYIVDRTRNSRGGDGSMTDPAEVIEPYAYAMALWEGQPERVEAWIEKDALVGVLQRAASGLRIPYFACRGYNSQSEAWRAAQRIEGYFDDGAERVTILHLGDHDPSGIDMTRDVEDRFRLFLKGDGYDPDALEVRRLALNLDQVRRYNPPPNPAKLTDSRVGGYLRRFGSSSWELDALEPTVIGELIQSNVRGLIDDELWQAAKTKEAAGRATLRAIKDHYATVIEMLSARGLMPDPETDEEES